MPRQEMPFEGDAWSWVSGELTLLMVVCVQGGESRHFLHLLPNVPSAKVEKQEN